MNDCLYHYTNESVLKRIIESNSLLTGSVKYMNDFKEYHLILDPLYAIFSEYRASCAYETAGFYISNRLTSILELDRILHIYAFCMTPNGNLLSQWIAYGSNGLGYSISFDISGLQDEFGDFSVLDKVKYSDENAARRSAETLAKAILDNIGRMKDLPMNDSQRSQIDMLCENSIDMMENVISFIKHDGFSQEEESRLVLKRPFVLNELESGHVVVIPKNEIETQRIRIHPKSGKLPISRIYAGPRVTMQDREEIMDFLIANTYEGVEIIPSQIPYRG